MDHRIARVLVGVSLLLALTTGLALAWPEEPPAKITISGPGLQGTVEVLGPDGLEGLEAPTSIDYSSSVPKPQGLRAEDGYLVTRFYQDGGSYWEMDHFLYFPNAAGGRGLVNYRPYGNRGAGGKHMAGSWFYATATGDEAMSGLLARLGSSPSAQRPAQTAQGRLAWQPDGLIALGAVVVAGGSGWLGVRAGRRKG